MLEPYIHIICYVTGIGTASTILIYLAPGLSFKYLIGVESEGPLHTLFTRQAGISIGAIGLLIFAAGFMPELRRPVLAAAVLNKSGFVLLYLLNRKEPFARLHAFWSAALLDIVMVTLYLIYLFLG